MSRIERTEKSKPISRYDRKDSIRLACYLCGSSDNLDREHVFPRVLFRPNDLEDPLILSACRSCNSAKASNEEYVSEHFMWTTETPEAEVSGKKFIEGVKKRVPLVIGKEKILRNARAARLAKLTENMTDVTIRSPSGIILGEGGQIKIDSKKFSDFYSDIAKGLFVAASGSHKDWSEYTIHQQFDSFTYGKHWNKDTYLLPFQHSDFREEWDRHLIFSGFVRTFPSGVSASMWSVAIYNEQLGIVVFRTKTD